MGVGIDAEEDAQSLTDNPWLQGADDYRRHRTFLYRSRSRQSYDQIYDDRVRERYKLFHSETWLSTDAKARIEHRTRTAVLLISAYDARTAFREKNFNTAEGMGTWVVILPSIAIALGLPFTLNADPFAQDAAAAIGGVVLGAILSWGIIVKILEWLQSIGSRLSGNLPFILAAVLIGTFVVAGILQLSFWGQEALLSALLASLWLVVALGLWIFYLTIADVLLRRRKARLCPEDEIIDITLASFSNFPPSGIQTWDSTARKELSSNLLSIAHLIELAWPQLAPPQISGTSRTAIHQRFMKIAASIRRLALDVIFAQDETREEVKRRLTNQLEAVTSGNWGNLRTEDPPTINVASILRRALLSLRSIIVAIGPISLVFIVPRVLAAQDPPVEVDDRLIGSLATISVAWLAVFLISWLDPRASQHIETTGSVLGMIGRRDRQGP